MKDWIVKLDDFLRTSDREILTHAGSVSHEAALEKARLEFEKYQRKFLKEPSQVEKHFIEAIKEINKLGKGKSRKKRT
jgi:hypothetical protein